MTKPKLTPWFPGTVKPMRRGVYQRKSPYNGNVYFAEWTGRGWRACANEARRVEMAVRNSGFPDWQWCGLAEKP